MHFQCDLPLRSKSFWSLLSVGVEGMSLVAGKKKYQEEVAKPSQNWKALGANKFPRTVGQEGLI